MAKRTYPIHTTLGPQEAKQLVVAPLSLQLPKHPSIRSFDDVSPVVWLYSFLVRFGKLGHSPDAKETWAQQQWLVRGSGLTELLEEAA